MTDLHYTGCSLSHDSLISFADFAIVVESGVDDEPGKPFIPIDLGLLIYQYNISNV